MKCKLHCVRNTGYLDHVIKKCKICCVHNTGYLDPVITKRKLRCVRNARYLDSVTTKCKLHPARDSGCLAVAAQLEKGRQSRTTAAVYQRACDRLKIQPSPAFLRQCNLTSMDLRDVRLGPADVKPIAIALVVGSSQTLHGIN